MRSERSRYTRCRWEVACLLFHLEVHPDCIVVQPFEAIGSGGEAHRLIDELDGERFPAVDLARETLGRVADRVTAGEIFFTPRCGENVEAFLPTPQLPRLPSPVIRSRGGPCPMQFEMKPN
jgi:hypothetical protein